MDMKTSYYCTCSLRDFRVVVVGVVAEAVAETLSCCTEVAGVVCIKAEDAAGSGGLLMVKISLGLSSSGSSLNS